MWKSGPSPDKPGNPACGKDVHKLYPVIHNTHRNMKSAAVDSLLQLADCLFQLRILLQIAADFLVSVDDSGVVSSAEVFPDFRKGEICEFPAKVHGDLTGKGDRLRPFLAF